MTADLPSKITAENLRSVRKAAGLTQSALGQIVGIDKESVCRVERGGRALTPAERIVLEAVLLGREIPQIGESQAV